MRLRLPLGALFATVLVVPTVVIAPTVTAARAEPRPVSASLSTLPLAGVDGTALRTEALPPQMATHLATGRAGNVSGLVASARVAAGRTPAVLTPRTSTDDFQMAAVTWEPVRHPADVLVSLRYRTDGVWTDWVDLGGTDGDTAASGNEAADVSRQGTSPYFTGPADGVQVRVDQRNPSHPLPPGMRVDLIEPGTSAADAQVAAADPASSAVAGSRNPDIITRAEWGADESMREKNLDMSSTVKVAYVHHTVGTSHYSPSQGPAQVRGLYAYYVHSLGYSDIGYNFLVDKYGRIYEGRAGSITTSVRQAATGGFNTDTMAVAAMGNFMEIPASDAMVTSIGRLLGFRLASYHRNPLGKRTLIAEEGSSRYSQGDRAVFDVISGHRQAGYTACPGDNLFLRIPQIRRVAKHWMGANLVEPSVGGSVVAFGRDAAVHLKARVLRQQSWRLAITRGCSNHVVRQFSGKASPSDPIAVTWQGTNASGGSVPAGQYVLRLTSENAASRSVPWSKRVYLQVGAPARVALTGPSPAAAGEFVALPPTRLVTSSTGNGLAAPLMLGARDRVDVDVLGRAGVPRSGVAAVALSVQGSCASRATVLSVFPAGSGGTSGSVVQVSPGEARRGAAMVGVGDGGAITVASSTGAVSFAIDVTGYWTTDPGAGYQAVTPQALLGPGGGARIDTAATTFTVAGRAGVPAAASAVVLNVRQRADTQATRLTLRPAGSSAALQVTATPGRSTASRVVVPLGGDGTVRITGNGQARVSVDVAGYFAPAGGGTFHPVAPRRLTSDRQRLTANDQTTVVVGGRARVPATGVSAVVLAVTGTRARVGTEVTVTPSGRARYGVADLLVPRAGSRTNLVVVPLGRRDAVRVHNANGRLGLQVAVVGWFD